MSERNFIPAGIAAAILAVCCAAPMLVAASIAVGLGAWLAKLANVLIPALVLCAGLIGFALYRKQRRER
jgi:mercuric ion transport protein